MLGGQQVPPDTQGQLQDHSHQQPQCFPPGPLPRSCLETEGRQRPRWRNCSVPGPAQDGVKGFCLETEGRQPLDGEAALCQSLHKMGDQGSKRPVQCHITGGETKGQGRRGPAKVTHEGKAELGLGTGLSVPCLNRVHSRPPLCHKCQEAVPFLATLGFYFCTPILALEWLQFPLIQ